MSGCRYQRAIKQALNKRFGNTSSQNRIVAKLIADYSHQTCLKPGSLLLGHSEYFVIKQVFSPHWCSGWFVPPRIILVRGNEVVTKPRLSMRSKLYKKKIFHPFIFHLLIKKTMKILLKTIIQIIIHIPIKFLF